MAAVKYESDTYEDAEYWIATRNDYGPLVEKESTMSDTPSRFSLTKKLHSANQSNSSQSNDNPREPLPRISSKRPALSGPKKQLDGKRLKLDEAAQSSSAVVNDANANPGCSKSGQSIIIQDNQLMECAQTKETAAAAENVRSIATDYNDHELHVNDVANNEPTSHHLPDSLKGSSHLYSQMYGARRLVPIQEPVEKRIRLMNITKK